LLLYLLYGFDEAGHLCEEQYKDSKASIFYIDLRTPGRYEQFYWKVKDDPNVSFTKGKVAMINGRS